MESPENLVLMGWPGSGIACLHRFLGDALPDRQAFYQPFHPRLREILQLYETNPDALEKNWEEPVDGISPRRQFTPYFERSELIHQRFDPAFGGSSYYRETGEAEDDIADYLVRLVKPEGPVILTLARGPGRAAFLKDCFPAAGMVLLLRDPLSLWIQWHGPEEPDPFSQRLSDSVHQVDRRYRELEARLPGDQWTNWGFEWARNRAPVARFLVVWGLTHYLALGQLSNRERSATLRWEELRTDSQAVQEWLGAQLELEWEPDVRIQPRDADNTPGVREVWRDRFLRLTDELPDTSPLPGILDEFDYPGGDPVSNLGIPG